MVLLFCTLCATSSTPVRLKFLRAVSRLNIDMYTDYYFSCRAVGRFLQWEYNGEPLTGFQNSDEVGRSLFRLRSTFEYTTTLLSVKPNEENRLAMNSIILVSFVGTMNSNFNITCSNGSYPETVQAGEVSNVTDSSVANETSAEIILNYVTSEIVEGTNTHIFICGVSQSSQLLQANGPPLSFESSDELGDHRVGSIDTYSVYEQGIFIARNPLTTTSIFIVTADSEVEVTCLYRNVRTSLYSNMSLLNNQTASIKNEPTTRTPTPVSEKIMSDDKNVESTSQAYLSGSTETLSSDIIIVNRVNTIVILASVMSIIIIIIVTMFIIAATLLLKYFSGIKHV